MSDKIKNKSLGDILLQSGYGIPTHEAPTGSKYFDIQNGKEYLNNNSTNWSDTINYNNYTVVRSENDFGSSTGGYN